MLPSGTVTLLFTDVEGSTKLWAADKDAMSASLLVHDAILRAGFDVELNRDPCSTRHRSIAFKRCSIEAERRHSHGGRLRSVFLSSRTACSRPINGESLHACRGSSRKITDGWPSPVGGLDPAATWVGLTDATTSSASHDVPKPAEPVKPKPRSGPRPAGRNGRSCALAFGERAGGGDPPLGRGCETPRKVACAPGRLPALRCQQHVADVIVNP